MGVGGRRGAGVGNGLQWGQGVVFKLGPER